MRDNSYSRVIRMRRGLMSERREYFDTELVTSVLEPPARLDSGPTRS